jgi:hypothetical protein
LCSVVLIQRNVQEQKKILGQLRGWSVAVTCLFSTCNCFEHSLLKNKTSSFILGVDGSWKKVHFHTGGGVYEVNGLP